MSIKEYLESNEVLSNIQKMIAYVVITELMKDGYIERDAFQ